MTNQRSTRPWTCARLGRAIGALATTSVVVGFAMAAPSVSAADTSLSTGDTATTTEVSVADTTWAADTATYRQSGSMRKTARFVHAEQMWAAGYTGAGVDIALIDTGVVPVEGLNLPGKVINGPDLSFESQAPNLQHLDTFGHGTHLGSIIAGKDTAVAKADPGDLYQLATDNFVGIAPDARLVNVKVGDANGAVDVSQVIAAIDWVVQHRNDRGMDIRVINLAYGTDTLQPYEVDPLAFAIEQAWRAGIIVVVAAGNDGNSALLRNPATNPYVIAVGALDTNGTNITGDDFITDFTNCGTKQRTIDVVAPGRSILGLRAPGSLADTTHPEARVDGRLFKGTGTSQATAVVSGSVALMLQQRPDLTPDQVKALLVDTADYTANTGSSCGRKKMTDLREILTTATPDARQQHTPANGLGSLQAARGSATIADHGVVLAGERDIFGQPWDGASWSAAAAAGVSWSGGKWNGSTWSGASWSGASWSGASWSGASWSGASWSGASWSGRTWSGASWSGSTWSGSTWSGSTWSGSTWSGSTWSGSTWSGHVWTGSSWT